MASTPTVNDNGKETCVPAAAPDRRVSLAPLLALLALPLVTMVAFTMYTGQVWEDFLITFRHTENLVRGNGLVYQPGERVHGFTSVLNTLVPAPAYWVTNEMQPALRFYQFVSVAVLIAGLGALLRTLRTRLSFSWWELGVLVAIVAASIKIVAFSTNGQEAGFLVGFVSLSLSAALRLGELRQEWVLAGGIAGLLYTRPDSPVYVGIIAMIALTMQWESRWNTVKAFARSAAVGVIAFLPWLGFAWWYYGSPIPHTVIAKSRVEAVGVGMLDTVKAVWSAFILLVADVFGPIYQPSNWSEPLLLCCTVAGLGAALYWLVPVRDRFGRICSAGLCLLLVYLSWIDLQRSAYPWYFVPASLLGAVVVARATGTLVRSGRRGLIACGAALALLVVGTSAVCLVLSFRQLRLYQQEVEYGVRREVGLWLHQNAAPGDTVYAECLGYVGYYYGGKMLDFPGLVAPEVVAARRTYGDNFAQIPVHLKPTWIAARLREAQVILSVEENRNSYDVVMKISQREKLLAMERFGGDAFLFNDAEFYILHRKP